MKNYLIVEKRTDFNQILFSCHNECKDILDTLLESCASHGFSGRLHTLFDIILGPIHKKSVKTSTLGKG